MLPNIYICGKAGAGKSTLANVLVAEYGYRRVALADGVKRAIRVLVEARSNQSLHVIRDYVKDISMCKVEHGATFFTLLNHVAWGKLENFDPADKLTYREFMQWWGTEIVRSIDVDTWIHYLLEHLPYGEPVVCDDVRFSNEEAWLYSIGWHGIYVCRKDYDNGMPAEQAAHESEQYIPQHCTMTIYNYNDCLADFKDHCLASLAEHFNDTYANILTGNKGVS